MNKTVLALSQQTTVDLWFHKFCKWIYEFNWLKSPVSVREFTRFCEQIWCVDTCIPWNHDFFHVMTCTSETVPVLTQYDSCQTRYNSQNTCILVNTRHGIKYICICIWKYLNTFFKYLYLTFRNWKYLYLNTFLKYLIFQILFKYFFKYFFKCVY